MPENGRLPASDLTAIGGGYYLTHEAAAAYLAMREHIHAVTGVWISVVAAYRDYARQVYFWDLYEAGEGNLAAEPGTSNHGLGVAIDLAAPLYRHLIDLYGAPFGWSKSWSDAPSEWWHIKWQPGHYKPVPHPPPIAFAVDEDEWIRKLASWRANLRKGSAAEQKARRGDINHVKTLIVARRAELRKLAKTSGWNTNDRRRRYLALGDLYNGRKISA